MAKEKKKKVRQEHYETAATETEVGLVHNLVNQGYKLKLQFQLAAAKDEMAKYEDRVAKGKKKLKDGELEEDPTFMLDLKLLESAGRWTAYNKVQMSTADTDQIKGTLSEIEQIRERQRGRVCSPTQ